MAPDLYPRTEISNLLNDLAGFSSMNFSTEQRRQKVRDTMDAIFAAIQKHQDAAGWRVVRAETVDRSEDF